MPPTAKSRAPMGATGIGRQDAKYRALENGQSSAMPRPPSVSVRFPRLRLALHEFPGPLLLPDTIGKPANGPAVDPPLKLKGVHLLLPHEPEYLGRESAGHGLKQLLGRAKVFPKDDVVRATRLLAHCGIPDMRLN